MYSLCACSFSGLRGDEGQKNIKFCGPKFRSIKIGDWSRSALSDFIVPLKAARDQLKAVLRWSLYILCISMFSSSKLPWCSWLSRGSHIYHMILSYI
jgi:hypothetical protein